MHADAAPRPAHVRRSARSRTRSARRGSLRRHPDRCRIVAGEPAPLSRAARALAARRRHRRRPDDRPRRVRRAPGGARARARRAPPARRALQGAALRPRGHPRAAGVPRRRRAARARARAARRRRSRSEAARVPARDRRDAQPVRHRPHRAPHPPPLHARLRRGAALRPRAARARSTRSAQRYPVVFLPSHKSNLDHLVLQYALHENGHPPNHTAGGINMNFFPVGPLVRRSGVFFIRRTFKDNPVYKFVLRQYIDYLIEKRFSLEWYIEGGRSRSGKLLPPRFGLLAYVVDAYRRGKSEDVLPDPGRRSPTTRSRTSATTSPSSAAAPSSARASAGSSASCAGCAGATATSTSASASRCRWQRRSVRPSRGAEPHDRRAEPRRCRSSPSRSRCASTA